MQNNNFRSLKLIEKKKRRKKIRTIIFSILGITIFVLFIFLLASGLPKSKEHEKTLAHW